MDAFKVIDNKGKAFTNIYVCSLNYDQWAYFTDLRDNLSLHVLKKK